MNSSRRINIRGQVDGHSAWGRVTQMAVSNLEFLGLHVDLRPTVSSAWDDPAIPESIKRCFVRRPGAEQWELLFHPPTTDPLSESRGKKIAWFTMWETNGLASTYVDELNKAELVIVPSHWNASVFSAAGVKSKIAVLPLGINTDTFSFKPMAIDGPFVVKAAGQREVGGLRKMLPELIETWIAAFPDTPDVELHVKISPRCDLDETWGDTRIAVRRENMSDSGIADWLASGHIFFSMSRGEGWGLWQQQAMAIGRPCCCPVFTSLQMFMDRNNAFPLDFSFVPAQGIYEGSGTWLEPDRDSAIKQLRWTYSNRDIVRHRGLLAAESASRFTELQFAEGLVNILIEHGIIDA